RGLVGRYINARICPPNMRLEEVWLGSMQHATPGRRVLGGKVKCEHGRAKMVRRHLTILRLIPTCKVGQPAFPQPSVVKCEVRKSPSRSDAVLFQRHKENLGCV